jgi:hypothetical protein
MFFKKKENTCANLRNTSDCNLVNEIKNLQKLYKEKEEQLKYYKNLAFDSKDFNNFWEFFHNRRLGFLEPTDRYSWNSNQAPAISEHNFQVITETLKELKDFNGFIEELEMIYTHSRREARLRDELNNLKWEIEAKKKQLGID